MLWVLVTIVLPLVLPVLAMLCLQLFPQVVPTADWITPIKDGQLCWGAIGMAFSGMYDVPLYRNYIGTQMALHYSFAFSLSKNIKL